MVFESNQSQFCLNCVTFRWKEHLHEILNRTSFQFRLICLTWTFAFVLCKISQISSFATHMAFTTWISLFFSQEFHVSALSNKFQMNIIWGTLKMFLWYRCFIISSWQNHFEKDKSCIRSRSKYQILVHLCT